ncbi:hypothetical protein M9397_00475 [Blochmannia endosymbiont of Camponotus sp. C-003]|nr:hypothetical protein M9397_00475 [Blochmannia endosymbiont of Camponotus sp. C-003]URJ29069.1 hypothetical protein M9409_00580 [Blochmannia endosymbiont of Camponotus sp. C-046]
MLLKLSVSKSISKLISGNFLLGSILTTLYVLSTTNKTINLIIQ